MDTSDQILQDLEERVLGVVAEAMDFAYHEGVLDALDTVEAVEAETEDSFCSCGCGLTEDEIEDQLLAAISAQDGEMINDIPGLADLEERLEAVEEYVGLKFTG